jgi:hypothetical protein
MQGKENVYTCFLQTEGRFLFLIDYILILLAVACFAAQFAFTKLYEGALGQSGITTMVMLCGASAVGALIFLLTVGGHVQLSRISLIWAISGKYGLMVFSILSGKLENRAMWIFLRIPGAWLPTISMWAMLPMSTPSIPPA